MAWLARDHNGNLNVYDTIPERCEEFGEWIFPDAVRLYALDVNVVMLPSDADVKLIGKHITWKDEPIKI